MTRKQVLRPLLPTHFARLTGSLKENVNQLPHFTRYFGSKDGKHQRQQIKVTSSSSETAVFKG